MNLLRKGDHNIIEQPIAPFIQKDPPRFQWAKKFNNVQTDEVLRNTETKTQYYEDSVLAVARDQNQRKYGIRSWYGPKIKNFRPPLRDPQLDFEPLSRIPRPKTQARTNPTMPYKTQNNHDSDVGAYINPRRLKGAVISNREFRMENPTDYEVVPDLLFNRPQTCATSGHEGAVHLQLKVNEHPYLQKKTPNTKATTIKTVPYHSQTTPLDSDKIHLDYSRVQTGADSYKTTPINKAFDVPEDINLQYSRVQTSGESISTIPYHEYTPIDSDSIELYRTTPLHDTYTNPSIGIDKINYDIQDKMTIDRIHVGYQNSHENPYKNADSQRYENIKLKPNISRGSYHTIGNMPQMLQHQNVYLKGGKMGGNVSSFNFA